MSNFNPSPSKTTTDDQINTPPPYFLYREGSSENAFVDAAGCACFEIEQDTTVDSETDYHISSTDMQQRSSGPAGIWNAQRGGGATDDKNVPPSVQKIAPSSSSLSSTASAAAAAGAAGSGRTRTTWFHWALWVWFIALAGLTYVMDAHPLWVFILIWSISLLTLLSTLAWRTSWYRKFRRFISNRIFCCSFCRPMSKESKTTKKQLSPLQKQVSLLLEMSIPYFRESARGRWLFLGMLVLTLLNSAVSVYFSYAGRDFYSALETKDGDQFRIAIQKYALTLLTGAPVNALWVFQRSRLAISWRTWMTDRTLELYTRHQVYYRINRDEIDNPDQRISEDVHSFTSYSLRLLLLLLGNSIDLVSFSIILYSIQPQLFVLIIAYAVVGTVITSLIGKRLVALNFERLVREADFRYILVRLRENAESIAFYKGEQLELQFIAHRFGRIIGNWKDIIGTQLNLDCFSGIYHYMSWIVPIAIVAPQYFAGAIPLGQVTQARMAFISVLGDLSIIVHEFQDLSAFSAGIDRLSYFYRAIREADDDRDETTPLLLVKRKLPPPSDGGNNVVIDVDSKPKQKKDLIRIVTRPMSPTTTATSQPVLSVSDLTLCTPDNQRTLFRHLSFSISRGQHLLIVGNSGCGKSSLLRCIAGLWRNGLGTIERPDPRQVYFLPQRPYCTLGSLRDQLLYPAPAIHENNNNPDSNATIPPPSMGSPSDEELLQILEWVDLSHLTQRLAFAGEAGAGGAGVYNDARRGLDQERDWSNTLSLGEQQRLAFARVLAHRPRLVVLDESTSAMGVEMESKMYDLLKRHMGASNGTFVSVGHRPSLLAHHSKRLRIVGGPGPHEFTDISEEMARQAAETVEL